MIRIRLGPRRAFTQGPDAHALIVNSPPFCFSFAPLGNSVYYVNEIMHYSLVAEFIKHILSVSNS